MPIILPGSGVDSVPAATPAVNSRLTLMRHIAKDLGYASGTATSGTTTTIVDSSADSPLDTDDTSSLYANAWAKIESDSAGTPLNVGEVRRIDATGYSPSTQTITTRAFTDAVTNTQSYGIYFEVPPTRVGMNKGLDEYINERLRNSFFKNLFLLTDVTDGDMEASGTTNYSGTNATLAKVTSGSGVTNGDQALQVTTTAANGYCTLATAKRCTEDETWEICVDTTPTSGIWKLQAWDVTADEEIDVTDTYDGIQPRRLWLRITIPSDCEQFNIRLVGETNTTVCVFDNISVWPVESQFFALPNWFIRPDWLEEVWFYPPGALRNNAYAIGSYNRYHPFWFGIQESYTDITPFKLETSERPPSGSHVFIASIKPFGELSADTDGSDIDMDFLKYAVLLDIYSDKGDKKNFERCAMRFEQLGLNRHVPNVERRAWGFGRPL